MKKNLIISLCSASAKVLGTVALVSILARVFSLSHFGEFTYSLTLGTIFSLLVDYGYNMKLIKDVSLKKKSVEKIVGTAFYSKIILFSGALIFLLVALNFMTLEASVKLATLLIFISLSFYSQLNTFLSLFKGLKDYLVEFRLVVFDNLLTFFTVSIVAYATKDIVWTSGALMISRAWSFAYALYVYRSSFRLVIPLRKTVAASLAVTVPYAVHYWVGNAYLNIDTIIMETMVTPEKIAIYQSGIRIVMGLGVLLTAINAVYLPLFNEAYAKGQNSLLQEVKNVNGKLILFALFVAVVMTLCSKIIILILFGSKFLELNQFFWVIALIVFLRIIGASYGILLTISDKQTLRAIAGFLSIVLIAALDYYLIPLKGYMSAAYVLLMAHVFITSFYIISVYVEHGSFFVPDLARFFQKKDKE